MTNSILDSTKEKLGLAKDYTVFDGAIIDHINSVFFSLNQLGVGPAEGYSILDDSEVWEDFLGSEKKLQTVKSYMYLKVRLLFDPPTTSFAIDSMNKMASEMEWRMNIVAEGSFNAVSVVPPTPSPLPY
jgi:hypothetical protein